MKTATIEAELYENCVWPACATATPEGMVDLRMSMKLLTQLEAEGTQRAPVDGGGFQLNAEEVEFSFEDDVAAHLLKKLEAFLPRMQTWAAVKMLPLVTALEPTEEEKAGRKKGKK